MIDGERWERLQRLASRVACWGDQIARVEVVVQGPGVSYVYAEEHGGYEAVLLDTRGDVDALEEALLLLAGEPPSWVEPLATSFEDTADKYSEPGVKLAFSHCAERLRERAHEGV